MRGTTINAESAETAEIIGLCEFREFCMIVVFAGFGLRLKTKVEGSGRLRL